MKREIKIECTERAKELLPELKDNINKAYFYGFENTMLAYLNKEIDSNVSIPNPYKIISTYSLFDDTVEIPVMELAFIHDAQLINEWNNR